MIRRHKPTTHGHPVGLQYVFHTICVALNALFMICVYSSTESM